MPDRSWIVCKFGGTSVSTRPRWDTIADIIRTHRADGFRPFLVCSALSGISDRLEALLAAASGASDDAPADVLAAIRKRHLDVADALDVDGAPVLEASFERLEHLVASVEDAAGDTPDPAPRAAVMAMGELMSTRLGAAFLNGIGVHTNWLDAREMLRATDASHVAPQRRYLSATCRFYPDPLLQSHLADQDADVYLTQGFIASNALSETVLLGRGGSDTSAAYFAAKLDAARLEIWTDVPGMFTANPRDIPSARLLNQLAYDEAQEIATMGGKVLHPRCLDPVRQHHIPLHVRSTDAPALDGTAISDDVPDLGPQVKAISAKRDVTAISMDTLGMWQQVGFLADVFQVFKHNGLSVDLVATSEANVTVTLDPVANALDPEILDRLLHDLNQYCTARLIEPVAVVSLIGRHIRSLLHELGPSFEVFDEQKVHLVSQAASDLNFSFVVDEEQAPRLVRQLHAQLFAHRTADAQFGPSWQELFDTEAEAATADAWWRTRRDALLDLADADTPRYVYNAATIRQKAAHLQTVDGLDRLFYAVKANPHPDILRLLNDQGVHFECVSPGEVERVFDVLPTIDPQRVLFQPNFAGIDEYAWAFARGVRVTLDNVEPLADHPDVFAGRDLFVRVDPGRGHGHHRHVRTAGPQSKFGVVPDELPRLRTLADAHDVHVVGLHVHLGSGITDADTWADVAHFLGSLADDFPTVKTLNLGGGLGVPDRPSTAPLDVDALERNLATVADAHPDYAFWMEPGRYLVAESGVLLARVTQTKDKGTTQYVGLDAGMNTLLRPALYGAYHEIVNLTRLEEPPAETVEVVGPICETGDVLGHSRRLPATKPGDVLLVATTGAYGASMANRYNLRPPAAEVVLPVDAAEAVEA
jgi:diaminopimelate decarboxylase/aspartate kinase